MNWSVSDYVDYASQLLGFYSEMINDYRASAVGEGPADVQHLACYHMCTTCMFMYQRFPRQPCASKECLTDHSYLHKTAHPDEHLFYTLLGFLSFFETIRETCLLDTHILGLNR